MKKVFVVEDIDCANCARKLEEAIQNIEGVESASLNFLTGKLTVQAADDQFDDVMKKIVKTAKKIEPDCRIGL